MKKTTFIITDTYDEPVGHWWNCSNCNNEIFIANSQTISADNKLIKFCPYCGLIITIFNKKDIEV